MPKRLFITDKELARLLEVSPKTLYRSLSRAPLRRDYPRQLDLADLKPVIVCGTRRWRVSAVADALGVSPDEIEARLA